MHSRALPDRAATVNHRRPASRHPLLTHFGSIPGHSRSSLSHAAGSNRAATTDRMGYSNNLWLFFLLLAGIILVPGMDMLFVLANALTGGRARGLAATFGVMAGGAVHSLAGGFGIGLLLAVLPSLFRLMLIAGAAYMVWIGLTLLRSSIAVDDVSRAKATSRWQAFRQGLVTCLINPKAYLFVSAVFPQFLSPRFGALAPQLVVMGAMTVATQFVVYGGLAVAAGASRDFLVTHHQMTAIVGRATGALFLAIAAWTAWHAWQSG